METYGLEQLGIVNTAAVYRNLTPAQLDGARSAPGRGDPVCHRGAGGKDREVHRAQRQR